MEAPSRIWKRKGKKSFVHNRDGYFQAALPFGAADVKVASTTEQRVPPSLNQLKNSYGLSQLPSTTPLAQQSLYQNHFPQQGSVCAMVKAAQQQSPSQHAPMPNLPFSATLPQVAQSAAAFAQPPATHFPAYFPPAQPMFFPGAQQPVTPQVLFSSVSVQK